MNAKNLLVLSIALNLVLGMYLVKQLQDDKDTPPMVGDGAMTAADPVESEPAEPVQAGPVTPPPVVSPPRTFNWEVVESPDYQEYIANLRAIGCPEDTIRDIIIADVNKLYAAKKRELRGEPKRFEFWKAGSPLMGVMDSEYLANARAMEEEKLGVLRQLGIEPDVQTQMNSLVNAEGAMDMMFGYLPEEKQMSVMKIMQDMQTEMAEAAGGGAGVDGEAIMEVQRKMEQAIKDVLSPEEYRDYELRMSMTANTMRQQLTGWDPGEEEFLQVFDLRKAFDEEFGPYSMGNEDAEERQQRQQAETELKAAIKEAIGDDRYAAYERAQDWNFQQIVRAANKADLGTDEAVKVYDMRQVAIDEVGSIRADQQLSQAERTVLLEDIHAETERSIKEVLGEEGWDQYNRGANAYWLNSMIESP